MKNIKLTLFTVMISSIALLSSDICAATKKNMKKESEPTTPINEALTSAYLKNSTLKAKVFGQFANQENIDIAVSGFRPSITATGNASRNFRRTNTTSTAGQEGSLKSYRTTPYGANLQIQQNLFQGGGTIAAVRGAKQGVESGHYDLLNTEQTTLLNAAQAYLNIIYTKSAVQFNKENVKFLIESLKSIQAQVEVGEKTRTDTAQAESALAKGYADLSTAEGNYQDAIANYVNVVGEEPTGRFVYPSTLPNLPSSREDLVRMSLEVNPTVLQAMYAYEQAKSNVSVASAKLLPSVDLVGSAARNLERNSGGTAQTNSASAALQLTVPIYQQGAQWATVRQQTDNEGQARYQLEQARKSAQENAIKAWDAWVVAKHNTESYKKQVEFATIFRDGAVLEEKVGERAYLDVLQAQSQLLQAQTGLEQAKANERIAEYQLYATVGILTAAYLKLPVQMYKEKEHLKAVEYKPFGLYVPTNGDMAQ